MRASPARLLVLAALLTAPAAHADEAHPHDVDAIPPGQEALVSDMLGRGVALPGGCAWAGASIAQVTIVSHYACAGGEVILELVHPDVAPPDAVRTQRFAFAPRQGTPPPGLVEALATRVREREASFQWTRAQIAAPQDGGHPVLLLSVLAGAGATLLGALGWYVARRAWGAGRPALPAGTRVQRLGALALSLLASLAICAFVHAALRALGSAAVASLSRGALVALAAAGARMLGCVLAALVAAALLARARGPLPSPAVLAAVAALYLAVGYPLRIPRDDLTHFGRLSTLPAGSSFTDEAPARPRLTYHLDAHGFRGGGFPLAKPPGTVRLALIGDSYVFGIGVADADTLGARLAAELAARFPDRRLEVLNLGIPGDNLASYVDLFDEATARLAPDLVVIGLTLPNDLSPWDDQRERRDARRVGAYSFSRFLAGDAAAVLWDYALLDSGVTPAGLARLDAEIARLTRLRAAAPTHPLVSLFAFRAPDPAIAARLANTPETPLVTCGGPELRDDFIPVDGHPAAPGNRRFAACIAADLQGREAPRRILAGAPAP